MKYKRGLLIICFIFCVLFSISSVVAIDINETTISNEDGHQIFENSNKEIISVNNEEIIDQTFLDENLSTTITVEGNTFSNIQTAIDNAGSGDTIKLNGTYIYDDTGWGIIINTDNLTIDGGGTTVLDGKNQDRMFHVRNGDNVVIKNIKFINGAGSYGGALYLENDCLIDNCQFGDCGENDRGGAIYICSLGINITNCIFENCYSSVGGAIYVDEWSNGEAHNCQFEKCSSIAGGIISANEQFASFDLYDCIFKDNLSPITESQRVNIFNTDYSKVTASNLKMLYSDGSALKVKVYGTDGKLASGVSVVIKVNGKKVTTVKTNVNGIATYKPTQTYGTYKISATALGKTVTKTLTVKHLVTLKSVTVKKSAKKLVLQATLGKVNGKYLKNKQVTFKFNGKTYKAKTSSKGVAKVTIKSSVLKKLKVGKKVTYQATYIKDTVKKTVKIKK